MYTIHNDTQYKRMVIENRAGKVFAVHGYPNPDLPMLQGDNLKAYQGLVRLVKLANLGLDQLKKAETEIVKLESLIEDFS